MKTKILLLVGSFFLLCSSDLNGQGIEFFHGSFDEALQLAGEEEKLIFVDAFTTWCGPCKRMAKNVFTDEGVGDVYNSNFINLKIDMEQTAGFEFGAKYPVSAYPSMFYINEKGEVLKKVVGGKSVEAFIAIGKDVAQSYDRSGDFAALYEAGDHSYELVVKYVHALNSANKPSLKIANDFLRANPNLEIEKKANFLWEAMTTADSRIFDLFIAEKSEIQKLKGKEAMSQKIEDACWNTIETALQFESRALVQEAKDKMKAHHPQKDKSFGLQADYTFAKATGNTEMMKTAVLQLAKEVAKNDGEALHDLCNEVLLYKSLDASLMETSEKIAKMAVDNEDNVEYHLTYSKILAENDKRKKALKSAEKALKKVEPGSKVEKEIIEWIESLKA